VKRPSGSGRTASELSESLRRRLNMYAIAAGTTGVGVLALAQPSEAKIVYTHTHVVFYHGSYKLDLNHDSITDFTINARAHSGFSHSAKLWASSAAGVGNVVEGKTYNRFYAAALTNGAEISAGQIFQRTQGSAFMADAGKICIRRCYYYAGGNWAGVTNRYLGLKFKINGKTHYGWARLSVQISSDHRRITATLTGFAYETIPGKSIKAGQTKGLDDFIRDTDFASADDSSSGAALTSLVSEGAQAASLGMLALGARSVPLWRREESAQDSIGE
jgi:hypothetical protein